MDRAARHLCNNVEGPSNTVENVLNLLPFLSELRFEEPLRRDFLLYLESLHGLFSGSRAPSPGKALSGFPARSRISLNMSEPEDSRHRRPGLRPNAAISNLMRVPEELFVRLLWAAERLRQDNMTAKSKSSGRKEPHLHLFLQLPTRSILRQLGLKPRKTVLYFIQLIL